MYSFECIYDEFPCERYCCSDNCKNYCDCSSCIYADDCNFYKDDEYSCFACLERNKKISLLPF